VNGVVSRGEMTNSQFRCDMCGGTFDKEWSKEEAETESLGLFGPLSSNERAIVCDDCFAKVMARVTPESEIVRQSLAAELARRLEGKGDTR
jgi:hypothetical protein